MSLKEVIAYVFFYRKDSIEWKVTISECKPNLYQCLWATIEPFNGQTSKPCASETELSSLSELHCRKMFLKPTLTNWTEKWEQQTDAPSVATGGLNIFTCLTIDGVDQWNTGNRWESAVSATTVHEKEGLPLRSFLLSFSQDPFSFSFSSLSQLKVDQTECTYANYVFFLFVQPPSR